MVFPGGALVALTETRIICCHSAQPSAACLSHIGLGNGNMGAVGTVLSAVKLALGEWKGKYHLFVSSLPFSILIVPFLPPS
jgi:hypothetical protein